MQKRLSLFGEILSIVARGISSGTITLRVRALGGRGCMQVAGEVWMLGGAEWEHAVDELVGVVGAYQLIAGKVLASTTGLLLRCC